MTHSSFTEETLATAFRVAGFTPVAIFGERIGPASALGVVRVAARSLFRAWWRAFMVAELGPTEAWRVPLDYKIVAIGEKP